jgi:hypothetical protein
LTKGIGPAFRSLKVAVELCKVATDGNGCVCDDRH